MKFLATASTLLAVASAQVQSDPFKLKIKSNDASIDGKGFVACHTGAAIESLCLTGSGPGSNFFFNTTEGQSPVKDGYTRTGALIWNLPIEPTPLSSPMSFWVDPSTNVALPLFQPSYDTTYVTFEKETQELAIAAFYDDTKTPPKSGTYIRKNWYVCQTQYLGYQYQTLNWVIGTGKAIPQNPSCVKVQVVRKFV